MPTCHECGKTQATAEMRRSKKVGVDWVCKDADPCKERKRAAQALVKGGRK